MATTIKCLKCGDVITSAGHRHNFVSCSCGHCYVDGGDEYSRVGGDEYLYKDYKTGEWVHSSVLFGEQEKEK